MEFRYSALFVLILCAANSVHSQDNCENIDCSKVKCLQRYDPFKCPQGSKYSAKGALCGCCPACVYYKAHGERCLRSSDEINAIDLTQYFTPKGTFPMDSAPVIKSDNCAPGLKCVSSVCQYPNENKPESPYNCAGNADNLKCDTDGTFAAVQCKANGPLPRCFCYSKFGRRIFGWDLYKNGGKMNCGCSRLVAQLSNSTTTVPPLYRDLTFHCSPNGNFEPLQCNNGLCACVDEATGQPVTAFVHESLWMNLHCYQKSFGGQFVRKCDSQSLAAQESKKELSQHGNRVSLKPPPCDPDGSYAAIQCNSFSCYCKTRANVEIGAYFVDKGSQLVNQMNCNCARDKVIFNELGKPFTFECEQTGNYKPEQISDNGISKCQVDSDGFYLTDCDF